MDHHKFAVWGGTVYELSWFDGASDLLFMVAPETRLVY